MIFYHNCIYQNSYLENKNNIKITESPILEISTEKSTFHEHEPIEILIKYINNSNKIDTIFSIDSYAATTIDFEIKDSNGEILTPQRVKPSIADTKPKYILNKNDTLIFSLSINNWYGIISKHNKNLKRFRYFPEGEYSIRAKLFNSSIKDDIYSNEIYFKTIKNNLEDFPKIDLINEKYRPSNLNSGDTMKLFFINEFNSNDLESVEVNEPFSSFIYYLYAKNLILKLNESEISFEQFFNKFSEILLKYRNSVYNEKLLKSFFNTLKNKNIEVSNYFIETIDNATKNSLLNYLLYYNYKNIYLK